MIDIIVASVFKFMSLITQNRRWPNPKPKQAI